MALGYLFLLFVSLFVLSFLSVVLLVVIKNPKLMHVMIWMTTLFSVLLMWINVTSLPSNFYIERIIGLVIGIVAPLGLILHYRCQTNWARRCIVFSIIANIVQLFFF